MKEGQLKMTLYDRLMEIKDDNYKEFQAKLVPNISPDLMHAEMRLS